jgi:hypothetical protein
MCSQPVRNHAIAATASEGEPVLDIPFGECFQLRFDERETSIIAANSGRYCQPSTAAA